MITKRDVAKLRETLGVMSDLDPQVASEQLWPFLNLNSMGNNLRESFQNVAKLNGFEAWRKVTEPIRKVWIVAG